MEHLLYVIILGAGGIVVNTRETVPVLESTF